MMKPRILLTLVSLMVLTLSSAQTMRECKALKDGGRYLEAAQQYQQLRQRGVHGKALLDVLFPEAECYYMLDDYQQLDSTVRRYIDCYRASRSELGDSLDVYKAFLYKMLGNYLYGQVDTSREGLECAEQARKYYMSSLLLFASRASDDNVFTLFHELAQLFYKAQIYDRAAGFLKEVKNRYQQRLDDGIQDDEPRYYHVLAELALCHARMASEEKSDNVSRTLFGQSLAQIDSAVVYGRQAKTPLLYDWLRIQGKILMMQFDRLDIDNKKAARACYEQYVNHQRSIVGSHLSAMTDSQQEQRWLALHDFLYDCYRLGGEAPEMLYDLALFSKNYLLEKGQTADVRWKNVQKVLQADACALEFVQYRGANDATHLACLVLRKDSPKPRFVKLGATADILQRRLHRLFGLTVEHCMTYQHGQYELAAVKNLLYSDSALFHQIWTPELMDAIGTARKVYFAPDGFLHQLAIEYMMPDTLKVCYRLSSTRVLTRKKEPLDYSKLLVCGGMNYHAKLFPHTPGNDVRAYRFFAGNGSVSDLPGTLKEIRAILDTRHNPADVLLTSDEATDENFMQQLSRRFPLVHISTHGYFAGNMDSGTDLKPATTDQSMSKSGLIFTGASSALTDKDFNTNMFDGVLSASEVAKFDMRGTQLVTLSACQTALGDITADGVFGMQRALKMAGAQGLMVSLWSVGDLSSYKLFSFFYEELQRQPVKDIHRAWQVARQQLAHYEQVVPYFNMQSLDEDAYVMKFNSPNDLCPYILIDIY